VASSFVRRPFSANSLQYLDKFKTFLGYCDGWTDQIRETPPPAMRGPRTLNPELWANMAVEAFVPYPKPSDFARYRSLWLAVTTFLAAKICPVSQRLQPCLAYTVLIGQYTIRQFLNRHPYTDVLGASRYLIRLVISYDTEIP
jgi:hypothetical protein